MRPTPCTVLVIESSMSTCKLIYDIGQNKFKKIYVYHLPFASDGANIYCKLQCVAIMLKIHISFHTFIRHSQACQTMQRMACFEVNVLLWTAYRHAFA